MKTSLRAAALALVLTGSAAAAVPAATAEDGAPGPSTASAVGTAGVPSGYLVVLEDGAVAPATTVGRTARAATAVTARSLVAPLAGTVTTTFGTAFSGFAADLTPAAAAELAQQPGVASVEPDVEVRTATTQRSPIWSLDRSDQAGPRLDGRFSYPSRAGRGAHVYVVDTGLSGHQEFAGRVGASRNFVGSLLRGPDPDAWGDCDGHGTHVASTAVGTRWGVAKRATVHAIRVLDCQGGGNASTILAGLDHVARTHESPAVVNLSLSAPRRIAALDAAVRGLVRRGVSVAVAAGNSDVNACSTSPASATEALTVGATTRADGRAGFSNFGPCVDLFAPGVDITGARAGTSSGALQLSGTSMSSPLVAGALALFRAAHPKVSAERAQRRVLAASTRGRLGDLGPGSPDRLLRVVDTPPRVSLRTSCDGGRCTFTAQGRDDVGIRGYQWTFRAEGGRATKASGRKVTRSFGRADAVRVELTVVDTAGQRARAKRLVRLG